jgi:hypothetical protein
MDCGKLFAQNVNPLEVICFLILFFILFFLSYFLFHYRFSQIGPFARKELQYLFSSGRLPAHVFKKHFEYCCGTCKGDTTQEKVTDWLRLWLNASAWVVEKWNGGWMEQYILDKDSML